MNKHMRLVGNALLLMGLTCLAAIFLLMVGCADVGDDDEATVDASSDEVSGIQQAAYIAANPEYLYIAARPAPYISDWQAFAPQWNQESYDAASKSSTYKLRIGSIGFARVVQAGCVRSNVHSFRCGAITHTCPTAASLIVDPIQWRIGAPVNPWRNWSDSGAENWYRTSAGYMAINSSYIEVSGTRNRVICLATGTAPLYSLRHR